MCQTATRCHFCQTNLGAKIRQKLRLCKKQSYYLGFFILKSLKMSILKDDNENDKREAWSVECEARSVECGVWSVKRGAWSVEIRTKDKEQRTCLYLVNCTLYFLWFFTFKNPLKSFKSLIYFLIFELFPYLRNEKTIRIMIKIISWYNFYFSTTNFSNLTNLRTRRKLIEIKFLTNYSHLKNEHFFVREIGNNNHKKLA